MNCKEVETQLLDAEKRDDVLAHTASCASCAARLAEMESLTAAFQRIARNDASRQAPERLEARLLTAFRQPQIKVVPMPQSRTAAVPRWNQWVLAAAVVAILSLLALFAWRIPEPAAAGEEAQERTLQPSQQIVVPSPKTIVPPEKQLAINEPKERSVANNRMPRGSNRPLDNSSQQMPPISDHGSNGEPADRREIATDFIPLAQGYGLPMTEGGQVMRVELPRSALNSFGLPMDVNRASERIKADVIIGNDGIARAIRFVR